MTSDAPKNSINGAAQSPQLFRQARIAVMAAMESGNFDRARMLIQEIDAEIPDFAEALRIDIIDAYGLTL